MPSVLQYVVDKNGVKKSVLVPLKAWEDLKEKYKKLHRKVEILTGIQSGMAELPIVRGKVKICRPYLIF